MTLLDLIKRFSRCAHRSKNRVVALEDFIAQVERQSAVKITEREPEQPGKREIVKGGINGVEQDADSSVDDTVRNINQYHVIKKLGEGASSTVYLAADQEKHRYYALKLQSRSMLLGQDSDVDSYDIKHLLQSIREVDIMKQLNHPHIITLFEVIDDPSEDSICFKYASGGSLEDLLVKRKLSEEELRKYAKQTLKGIEYLHGRGIVHGDIKPGNLMLDAQNNVKISDFGSAFRIAKKKEKKNERAIGNRRRNSHIFGGTPAFAPPEYAGGTANFPKVTPTDKRGDRTKIDVWALGVTMYHLSHGKLPYEGISVIATYQAIKSQPIEVDKSMSQLFQDLLNGMLNKSVEDRFTLEMVISHPWMESKMR